MVAKGSTRFSKEQWEQAYELLQSGAGYEAASVVTGIGSTTLGRRLPGFAKARHEHTTESIKEAKRLLEDGTSYREASLSTKIPRTTLTAWFPGYGWSSKEGSQFLSMLSKNPVSKEVWDMNRRNNG